MQIKQLYTNCLAQGAYYIAHNGEAAIIDPLRETQPYLNLLKQNNDKLLYIFETHFHADFVSGHVDLSEATGAEIIFGPNAETTYKSKIATDNQEFKIGELTLKVLHTPGHTLESTTYLLFDENKKPHCIFTGDTLFIGDVGRPDLAIKSMLTQEDLAGMLYDSLRNKLMPLPDDVIVYPAHGAGSACGKNMSKETFDTLGNQKQKNYALQNISKADFVKELTTGILPAPQYFAKNANLNKTGYKNFDSVIEQGAKALSLEKFKTYTTQNDILVLDVRNQKEVVNGFVPNALFIGLDGQFAPWVGTIIKELNQKIILVAPLGREHETVMRLSRVGYDNCLGFLDGGFETWKSSGEPISKIKSISAEEFKTELTPSTKILDVRKPGEYEAQHLPNIQNNPLDFIDNWINNFDKKEKYYVHCAGGYRSVIAATLLMQKGYKNLIDVDGGFAAIQKAGIETTSFACSKK